MKLLLINPKFPESFWSFSWALDKVTRDKKTVNSPLGLATMAGLCPPDWEITIVDENIEPIDWSFEADLVGVCGMAVQFPRQKEILQEFRRRGRFVVAGGSFASLCPEEFAGIADTVISGEAEQIIPRFCRDFVAGTPQSLYQEIGEIDLTTSPTPRFDLLKLDAYQKVSLQFSRGCPFRCEFCDIIVMFGRKPRTKAPEQIGRELDVLRERGVRSVFFVDDNLIGHLPQAKKLLAYLIDYQKRHDYRFSFGTEASLNMAADQELMELFRAANFEWVFIGLETPSAEGLKETKKTQNLRGDLLTSLRTIYSYGLDIFAGFIVGFDADDATIFDRQYEFIQKSGIAVSMVGLLTAIPKTPLYDRLKAAGRLRDFIARDNTRPATNVIPQHMTYDEMVDGYLGLMRRLTDERAIHERITRKLAHLKDPVTSPHLTLTRKLQYFVRIVWHAGLAGGPRRSWYFFRSLARIRFRSAAFNVVLTDWAAALSLKMFAQRYFESAPAATETVCIELKDRLDRQVIRALSRGVRQALTASQGVVLDCRTLQTASAEQLAFLLKKLRRYRHQIHLRITEDLYRRIGAELVPFHYTLLTA